MNGYLAWRGVSEVDESDGCVMLEGGKENWLSTGCSKSANFLCGEKPKQPDPNDDPCPCECHINGQTYDCGESFVQDVYSCAEAKCDEANDGTIM